MGYSEEVQDVLTIYKASVDAAEEFLECEDEASKTPAYVQRLQELVQRTVSSCADVVDLCVTNVYVREFCSHTCSCSDMNAGLFLRSSCASACDTMIMAEVTAQETEMFYVNETETYCAYQDGNTSWVQLFFSDLQRYLVQEGYVNMTQAGTYQWTQSYASLFEKSTSGYLALLDVNMDLSKWLNLDNYTSACNAIWYFDNMFGTTLCLSASSLSANQGTLRGLCPRECGLCVDGDATLALTTDLELLELYNLQHKDFEHHLINFELMSLDQDGLNLECGRTVYGSTFQSSCSSGHHCVAANFTVGSSGDFVLDLCGSLQMDSWKTTVSVFDVDSGNEVTASYRDCCEPFAHLTVTLDAGKNYQVTISGSEGGTFSLELWCCGVGGNDCSDSCT